jgi:hypothetical protein
LSEEGLVGLGADAVDEVADLEFGVAEEGGIVGGDEGAGDGEELFIRGLTEGLSELLGLGFPFGGERSGGHERASVAVRCFHQKEEHGPLCTKIPPTFKMPTH